MAQIITQYKWDYVVIRIFPGIIEIMTPTKSSRKWATRQVKKEAEILGINLCQIDRIICFDKGETEKIKKIVPILRKCWVKPILPY